MSGDGTPSLSLAQTAARLLEIFDPREYPRLVGLVLAMVGTALLQTAGIASVVPFLAVVSNPQIIEENAFLAWGYDALGLTSAERYLLILGLLFVVVMVISNAANALTNWATVRVQWRNHEEIALRLLDRYLHAPYQLHLERNSARFAKEILGEVNRVIGNVFIPLTRIVARGISAFFIVLLLVWVEPLLALAVSITIGGFYGVAYMLVRRKQRLLGQEESGAKTERHLVVNEAIGGIKEIRVLGRERFFLERFRDVSSRYARAHSIHGMVGLVPRFVLETLAYGGVVAVVLYLLQARQTLDQIFPLLALYAFGANRLMPAVQEIFQAMTQIRFHAPALEELRSDLLEGSELGEGILSSGRYAGDGNDYPVPLSLGSGVRLDAVSFAYATDRPPVLDRISLLFPANQTSALVGATGAGKTTIVDLVLGLFEPTGGSISVGDTLLTERSLSAWRRMVGYVPQSIFLRDASISENIALGVAPSEIDFQAVETAARAAHLDEFVQTLPEGFDTVVGERGVRLSGGQRQRIGIARALYHDPQVLVMDEATSALDNVTEDVVMQAIRELGRRRTIILIAHRLTTVRECDIIYVLEKGQVAAQGTYDTLMASSPRFQAMVRA